MSVDLNPVRTRQRNPHLSYLVAAAQGRHHYDTTPGPTPTVKQTRPRRVTAGVEAVIIARLTAGHSDNAIARDLHISRHTVRRVGRDNGLDANGNPNRTRSEVP